MKDFKATNTELYMHSLLGLSHSYLEIRIISTCGVEIILIEQTIQPNEDEC